MMPWVEDDGGRAAAGYKGSAGDCAVRSVAIAAEMPYREAYELIRSELASMTVRQRRGRSTSPRDGVPTKTMRRLMPTIGLVWTPTMLIGSGCTVHLVADELPAGRLIVALSKHYCAVVDGVIRDTYDPNDRKAGYWPASEGPRCVYGYFSKAVGS